MAHYAKKLGGGVLKRISLPASTSINVKQHTDKWAELTTANFGYEINYSATSRISAGHQYGASASTSSSSSISYNPTTGMLTISLGSNSGSSTCVTDNSRPSTTLSAYVSASLRAVYMYIVE